MSLYLFPFRNPVSILADQVAPRRKRERPRGSTNKPKDGRGQSHAGPGRLRGSQARGRGRGRGRGQLAPDTITVHGDENIPDVEVDEAVGR